MKAVIIASILVLLAVFDQSSGFAVKRQRRDVLSMEEFRFPAGCQDDNEAMPCSYHLKWDLIENRTQAEFTWKAQLGIMQWVGVALVGKVSLVDANVITLSLIPADQQATADNETMEIFQVQLMPRLANGIMDAHGIVHELPETNVSGLVTSVDKQTGIVTAKFRQSLADLLPKQFDWESQCPIWIFLPEPGLVVPNFEGEVAKNEYLMKLPEGVVFYAYNAKC